MRVGLVVYGSLDAPSGGYRYDRELVGRLEARGATVLLFTQSWQAYPLRLLQSADRSFRTRIENAQLDVLLEDELNHPSLLSMTSSQSLPPRVSIVHHLRSSERRHRLVNATYERVEQRYLDGVDAFICNSETTAAVVRAISPRPRPLVVAKPAGRNVEPAPAPTELLAKAAQRPLRILFVGQLTRRKGLHTLLRAVTQLPKGEWRLDVVGDPDAEPNYARGCRAWSRSFGKAVRFHGHLDGAALDAVYRNTHLLCVPSQYEGYGIVFAEAHQYGLPVIATRGGAAHEIVHDERTGFLVPVESPKAVAAALARFADFETLGSFSLQALERARELPTWRSSMDTAVDFIERVSDVHQREGGRAQ